ncbi:transglutaminase-like protein [Ceratobasidium sp. AG-Ba]|nr:transglutaminase-like protein [Ceratobasidium sp. AG-Ba]QRW04718.1 F-box only protein 21 [Ceratobasidium sp. AG-Ba]
MPALSIPEVILAILARLPASKHDDTSVLSVTFIICLNEDIIRGTVWHQLYCLRRTKDIDFRSLLDTIIRVPSERDEAASVLCNYEGFAWDMLKMELECRVPEDVSGIWKEDEVHSAGKRWDGFGEEWVDGASRRKSEHKREDKFDTREIKPDWIQRRWWAKQALATISRLDAMLDIMRVFYTNQAHATSIVNAQRFERGMIALSGLMGVNTHEMSHNYDSLAQACKDSLVECGIEIDATSIEFDLKTFSKGVCDWMRTQGFRKTEGGQPYDDMMSSFPHRFMTTNRVNLRCSIATRLGLRAAPVGIIGHVHAWIALPSDQRPDSPSLSSAEEIDWENEQPLRRLHVDIIRRAASDLLAYVTSIDVEPPEVQANNVEGALYASAMTLFIAGPQTPEAINYIDWIISVTKRHHLLDTETVLRMLQQFLSDVRIENNQIPEIGTRLRYEIAKMRVSRVDVKKRNNKKYWVGMIFRHARSQTLGLIIGWDEADARLVAGIETDAEYNHAINAPSALRSESVLLIYMNIRYEAYDCFQALAADGIMRCELFVYSEFEISVPLQIDVAEENVVPLPPSTGLSEHEQNTTWDIVRALMQHRAPIIERTFMRVEVDEELGRARFVPAASTAEEYPEDTALGDEYLRKP